MIAGSAVAVVNSLSDYAYTAAVIWACFPSGPPVASIIRNVVKFIKTLRNMLSDVLVEVDPVVVCEWSLASKLGHDVW